MDEYTLNYLNSVYNLNGRGIENFDNTKIDKPEIDSEKDKLEWKEDCKDISDMPLPSILPAVPRIIVIGDLHGDWDMTLKSLYLAKVIDDDLNWKGKDTVIVQVGDQIDRCRGYAYKCSDERATINDEASDIKILKYLTKLHSQAQKEGGAVYSLLGNHELMNIMGDMRYVSYKGLKEFEVKDDSGKIVKTGTEARKEQFKRGSELSNFLACTRQAALIIGSNLFVHAGIIPQLAEKYNVRDINNLVRKWLLNKTQDTNEINKIIKSSDFSPFWFRIFGQIPTDLKTTDDYCKMYVNSVLEIYKINSMIVGHTPQSFIANKGINHTCEKKLWRVDVGMSDAFSVYDDIDPQKKLNRSVQVLEITDDKEFKILK